MKKLALIPIVALSLSTISTVAIAANTNYPPLDKVSFQLSAEQWATTQTAKVTVRVNATLTDSQLGAIHTVLMNNLKKIAADAKWHITEFNRSKNQSGLEQLYATAQARIPETALSSLRQKAKAVTKPGATYTIGSIDFSPSQAEIQTVKANLRSNIYAQTKAELARLNKEYPSERFFLHSINFNSGVVMPRPQMRTMVLAEAKVGNSAPMAVSDKITLNANVVLASTLNIK